MDQNEFNSPVYKRGRLGIIIEAALEYFIALCVTTTLLTALLNFMEVDPALQGIIGSITSLACVAQLCAVFWVKKSYPCKKWVCILNLVNQLAFLLLYCVPFISLPQTVKIAVFIAILLCACLLQHYPTPSRTQWHMSLVEDSHRGVFTAKKEIISLIGGMIFSMGSGALIDYFRDVKNDMQTCFIIFAVTIAVLAVLHLITMLSIKEPCPSEIPKKKTFREIISLIFGSKKLLRVLIFDALYCMSGVSVAFLPVFAQINEKNPEAVTLGLTAGAMAAVSVVHSIFRASVSVPLGRYADKRSWASLLRLCMSVMTVGYTLLTFCTPALGTLSIIIYVAFYLCYAFSLAGSNSSLINLCFDYVEHEDRRYILGIKNAISGVATFLTSLLWGYIVSVIQGNNYSVFGLTVYPIQLLSAISAVMTLVLVTVVLPGLKKDK